MTETLFNGKRAFKLIEELSIAVGTRPSGSEAETKAAELITSKFKEIGLDTNIQEFEMTTGKIISKKLEVIEPYNEEVGCEVMPFYGGTGPEGVQGELIYLETIDEEYLTPAMKGKIVLTTGGPKERKIAYPIISTYKPLAIIFIEQAPRIRAKKLWGSLQVKENYGEIPTARVTYEDGLNLLERGARRVRLIAQTKEIKTKSRNVIAELKGSELPDEIIVIGGHYDTVLDVPGAEDNAGGTAIVVELARIFIEKGTRRTIRFIAWGSEEVGLLGSKHYATTLREASEKAKKEKEGAVTELDRTLLCINLDVHGAWIGTNSSNILGPPELTASVKLMSKETGIRFNVEETVQSSDGTSLSAVGVPSVSFSRRAPTNVLMHSIEDGIHWLSPETIQTHGDFVELFLTRYVAKAAAFPFERTIPEKQKKDVEDYFKRALRKLP